MQSLFGRETGKRFTNEWSMTFFGSEVLNAAQKSPWHDIALRSTTVSSYGCPLFQYFNEIPRGQRAKLEVSTKRPWNPIVQDRVKSTGALRSFTYGDIPFNYGCLPRTWEDPSAIDTDTKCRGDGDPVDVVELSGRAIEIGAAIPVRILGVLALIDEGETDWKLLTVSEEHNAGSWKRLSDVPTSLLDGVVHWFRFYKTTDGKPENDFAFGGRCVGEDRAMEVVHECSNQYSKLISGTTPNPGLWLPS